MDRRQFFKAISGGGAVLLLEGLIGGGSFSLVDKKLTLKYPESPVIVEEGKVFEQTFGNKLKVKFLPLEHSRNKGKNVSWETLRVYEETIRQAIFDESVGEVWLEAYPKEMKNLSSFLPEGPLRGILDLALLSTHRQNLIEFFGEIERIIHERNKVGKKPVDIVCPDIVGGSPLVSLVSQKMIGLHMYLYILGLSLSGFMIKKDITFPKQVVKFSLGDQVVGRRKLLREGSLAVLASLGLALTALEAKSTLKHAWQMSNNQPTDYVTEDTVREAWLLWVLIEYGKRLDSDPNTPEKNILFIHTPPHIKAMMKRVADPIKFQGEMSLYFKSTPREIWERGVRRYRLDKNGAYQEVQAVVGY